MLKKKNGWCNTPHQWFVSSKYKEMCWIFSKLHNDLNGFLSQATVTEFLLKEKCELEGDTLPSHSYKKNIVPSKSHETNWGKIPSRSTPGRITSWRHFARSIFFHSSRMTSFRDWMLDGEWCSTCLFRISHRCSIGFRSGDILGHWITFTLFFFRNTTVALDVCLGSLSCWKSARRPRARSDGSIFSFSIEQYICEFMMPSMKCSSPTPAALMQPHIRTLPPPCFPVGTMHFSLYSSPLRRHTVLKPSVPKTLILVSSL